MRSRSFPVILAVILISCVTVESGFYSFFFGGSFIGQQLIVHTPPERGFIDRDRSEIYHEETPVAETDLITTYTQRFGN